MNDYFDFIEAVSTKPHLGKDFIGALQRLSPDELSQWFKDKGFQVDGSECSKIKKLNSKNEHHTYSINAFY